MTQFKLTTPVVLIIFNRPDTTAKVFEAIRKVKPLQLFVIADAPRLDRYGEVERCMAARKIIDQVDWNCEVLTNYSEKNLGCRERIYNGLNWVFSLVESAIILEDDCVPHLTFFRFCEELLERYRNDERIMAISGDNFQFGNNPIESSYYFSRYPHCWGWATWRRAWKNYDNQMQLWSKLRGSKWLENILQNSRAVQYWSEIFQKNYQGFNSWAYAWTFACWNYHGLTILPKVNLVSNIGFGQGATHTSSINKFANMSVEEMIFPLTHPPSIIRNIPADNFTEKTMFSGGLQIQNVHCKVCGSISHKFDNAKVLNKYNVDYFQCSNCGFVQTENPYWLGEAYTEAIASSDVGLVSRNQNFSLITENLILNFFNANDKFLDYGCGYGLFVRMMRDLGLDFYGYDKYCQNIFYQGWEGEINREQKYEIVTAFEVFEHFINPLAEIEKILQQTRNILFSTKLLPPDNPRPNDWWYYALEEGQHISIFNKKALSVIAQKFKLNLCSDGESLHLLTEKSLSNSEFHSIFRIGRYKPEKRKESLTEVDYEKVTEKKLKNQQQLTELDSENIAERKSKNWQLLDFKVLIDGVFFQINNTGIARVWKSLLEVWSKDSFAKNILVLDRAKTAPKIPGIKYRVIPGYNYGRIDADRQILQQICDEENADIFISTYYTTPILTPSIFMAYDMIPEVLAKNLDNPSWQEKHRSIKQAISYISISENTARDLVKYFPQISANSVKVAHCGIEPKFSRATPQKVANFKQKYQINRPYFLIVGERIGWLGYKNTMLFFQAFAKFKKSAEFEIVCIGGNRKVEPELSKYISGSKINLLQLSDQELKSAYSGAIALVYPSKYEGFGLPILEAMACGCPVITCKNASIPEVAGRSALYINDNDVNGLVNALGEVQKSEVRQQLITAGLAQAQKFSWSQMAKIMTDVFIQTFNQIKVNKLSTIEEQKNLDKTQFQINHGQLEIQRYFRKVNSLDEAMFERVLAYKGTDTVSPEEKKQVRKELMEIWVPQILEGIPVKPEWKVLEIGCGVGHLIKYLREKFARVDGVDISENMIQFARQYLADGKQNGELYINNGDDLQQLADENYDFVFSTIVFQHIRSISIVKSYFREIFRVLKPGGYLRIKVHDHSAESLGNFDEEGAKDQQYYFSGNAYTEEKLKDLLMAAGFNLVSLKSAKPWIWATVRREQKAEVGVEKIPQIATLKNNQMGIEYPEINPLPDNNHRPFWSVMIPTYKKVKYLEQTLKSVLQQAPAPEEMQIEVVNDCSDHKIQAEIEAIVRKVGGERVNFYRHFPQDIGQAPIFNVCLQRAKGYWIHLLHDDDFVLPGFYEKLRQGIEKNPTVGAAFCRHYYIDEYDQKKYLSVLERKTPGIIENFLEKITIEQRIQVVGMVVKRKVYENLGGFCSQADSAADWEIWKRITAFYPIWFEPEILACFRLHSSSETSRLMQSGGNIENARKAIEITQTYLPTKMAENLSNQAREHYAIEAIKMAASMLKGGNTNGAIAQIREGLKCSQSPSVVNLLISVLVSGETDLIKTPNQSVNSPKPQSIEQQKVVPTVKTNLLPSLTEINQNIQLYQQNQLDESALVRLQEIRKKIAEYWLNIQTSEELKNIYLGEFGQAHKALLASGIKDETLTEIEQIFVDKIKANIAKGFNQPLAIQYLLAGMLYQRADRLEIKYEKAPIPNWFATDYLKFMFASPQLFQEIGEADNYHHFLAGWLNYVHNNISTNPDSELWQAIAWFFVQNSNWIPLYFTTTPNLKNLYIKRAEIIEFALQNRGLELDYQMNDRPFNRQKIRLGILKDHYSPQTETYSLLPVFEHLDRSKFEIFLYAVKSNAHPLEKYCQTHADKFLQLPEELKNQAQIIRNDDLDILFIGSNITATIKNSTLLAIHKLARIQITSINSPTTTGMHSIDYYISGKITAPTDTTQEHYTEKLANLEGSGLCFRYAIADPPSGVKPIRSSWGATDQTTIFISGANFYKIIPEMRDTWAKILAKVPNSILVLYPFNPNWTNSYRFAPFIKQMRSVLKRHGIDSKRLVVIKALPSQADIKECLKLADIYLDSFPYGGATSLVDPLMVGVPPVVVEGNALRFRQASALLREIKMDDLIADGEESYINLVVKLATNPQLRQQKRQEILEKIEQNPSFLDSLSYSTQIGKLFQELFQEWQNIHAPKTIESTDKNSLTSEFINRLIGCVNLYEIDPTDQSLIEELRQIRKQIADFWLAVAPKELETTYQGKIRQAYQALLKSGIQNEPQTEDEQKFLKELAETSMGLTNPKAINTFLGAMLYFPPSKMLVRDAKNRLPQWLIEDYKQIFESREVAHKLEKAFKSKSPHLSENYSVTTAEVRPEKNVVLTANQTNNLDISQQKFINQLLGSVNLYYIDPSDESVVQELRQIRKQMADFWINLEVQKLETFYLGEMGKGYQALLSSKIQNESLIESEQEFLRQLAAQLSQGIEAPKAINYLLAAMLYCRSEQLRIEDITKLPHWLLEDYQKFVGNS
ncbi:methyltransferase domain-containing protein [Okeania hirsuta]|uniref:Methyltransferase domain-containing protein n=1 Tax=Okeania hirsuta TaxID=1458930 RepID=A0A3N6PEJ7_9CYAN|nr:methyltransferase domain-containing protein [Okeania hirsuta]RQH49055.1 methyltransferase domain-containing protein [Okeania hirsuta]